MIKNFRFYALMWGILFVVWYITVFLVRPIIPDFIINYDARFWIAFVFVIIAFIGNIMCAYLAFKAENLNKMFLHMPLISISWSTLIILIIVSDIFMLIPNFPTWITATVCISILAFNAITIVNSVWASNIVDSIESKTKSNTLFIKNTIAKVESIINYAKNDEPKSECKKVYDAIRYSDPMSNDSLSDIEGKIESKMNEFISVINADDAYESKKLAEEIVTLINERNKKCKLLK